MTTVFIGGSRKIVRLDKAVTLRLETIVEKQIPVLLGDANGADKAVQAYFRDVRYPHVTVYCTGDDCRNNLGGWRETHIRPTGNARRKDRKFFTLKDRAMSSAATHGLMLWDGDSLGTLVNIVRLRRENRVAVVYVKSKGSFVDVRSDKDLNDLKEYSSEELLAEAERAVASEIGERPTSPVSSHPTLF